MEIVPTSASFAGRRMMPEPIMLTADSMVSCHTFILLLAEAIGRSFRISPAALAQALQPIGAVMDLDAVGVVAETGEQTVDRFQGLEVAEDRPVGRTDIFARHQDRNARRIGHDAGGDATAGDLV